MSGMSEFDKRTKELENELKKNKYVQNGPNAGEYMKFLNKTLEKAQSFNTENSNYVNYAIGEKPKGKKNASPPADAVKLKKKSVVAEDEQQQQKVKKAKNPAKNSK